MDPLSIAASVTALAGLAKEVGLGVIQYYKGVKNASKQALEFCAELDALNANLDRLNQFLASHANEDLVFNDNSVLRTSIKACSTKLVQLQSKLRSTPSVLQRLKWPFDEKEHRDGMTSMKSLSQLIHFSLMIDSCRLLSQTSNDLQRVLGLQLEHFQELQKIEGQTNQIHGSIQEQAQLVRADRDSKLRNDILQWLSPYDPLSKHESVREPRVVGTGRWLLECETYRTWRDGVEHPNALWCYGIPGSGKSVLTSLVVDELKRSFISSETPLAYVYLDYRDRESQKPAVLIGGILKQILSAMTDLPSSILNLYESSKHANSKLQVSEALQALVEVCKGIRRAYIVLDALDEAADWEHRSPLLATIAHLRALTHVRLFVTSRPSHEDIRLQLFTAPQLEIKAQDDDLRTYLSERIKTSRAAAVMDDAFREQVIDTVANQAQDMFLLPELQIRSVVDQPTKGHMKKALQALPSDLPAALAKTINRIQSQPEYFSRLGMEALMWVSHAKIPMTAADLCTALAINESTNEIDEDFMPTFRFVIESCFGLLVADENDDLLRLCHFSVQEYLQDNHEELFASAELQITRTCLKYLAFEPFQSGPTQSSHDLKTRISMNPFAPYAALVWAHHARMLHDDSSVTMILDFIRDADAAASAHQLMQHALGYNRAYHTREESYSCTPLHFASLVGLLEAVQHLIASGEYDVDAETRMGTTSLIKAASRNHAEVVRVLLQQGAEITKRNRYGNSLHCAAEAGACDTISILVEAGLNIECERPGIRRTALHCAVDNNFHAAASLLLDLGANMYAEDKYGCTALEYAVENSAQAVVHVILQHGYDLNFRGAAETKPILHHIVEGILHLNLPMINLLLKSGADLEARHSGGDTILLHAIRNTCLKDVVFLVNIGADVNAHAPEGTSAVELAQAVQNFNEYTRENDPPFSLENWRMSIAITELIQARADTTPFDTRNSTSSTSTSTKPAITSRVDDATKAATTEYVSAFGGAVDAKLDKLNVTQGSTPQPRMNAKPDRKDERIAEGGETGKDGVREKLFDKAMDTLVLTAARSISGRNLHAEGPWTTETTDAVAQLKRTFTNKEIERMLEQRWRNSSKPEKLSRLQMIGYLKRRDANVGKIAGTLDENLDDVIKTANELRWLDYHFRVQFPWCNKPQEAAEKDNLETEQSRGLSNKRSMALGLFERRLAIALLLTSGPAAADPEPKPQSETQSKPEHEDQSKSSPKEDEADTTAIVPPPVPPPPMESSLYTDIPWTRELHDAIEKYKQARQADREAYKSDTVLGMLEQRLALEQQRVHGRLDDPAGLADIEKKKRFRERDRQKQRVQQLLVERTASSSTGNLPSSTQE